eukprot:8979370-Karenia_brevis.AAC.1
MFPNQQFLVVNTFISMPEADELPTRRAGSCPPSIDGALDMISSQAAISAVAQQPGEQPRRRRWGRGVGGGRGRDVISSIAAISAAEPSDQGSISAVGVASDVISSSAAISTAEPSDN